MGLKDYQKTLLDDYAAFLARTRELGDAAAAFRESTRKHFGYEIPYHPIDEADEAKLIPYVCLRVPTGGGKTMIAGNSIRSVNDKFLSTEHSLVLWLVPSDPIREQTLYELKTPGAVLHDHMRDLFGAVNVLTVSEALGLQPATLNSANTIIVATMQSFKRETPEGLRVYRQNGALMPHFEGVRKSKRGDGSLVDVIRLRRPYVIVDEAHNQGSPLSVETLLRLNPSCILELTATPDRASQPSNVLRSIAASVLQAAEMIKLPLELAISSDWKAVLTEAIKRVRELEKEAEEERKATTEIIDPVVMLIQAESARQGHETLTPPKVKEILINDFQIPAESIAIEYKDFNELEGTRLGDPDFPQFVITVDKLREGWDCPFAYVLFSFRNTTSSTAVEQILGRVLRMPHVTRKQNEPLNRSYAYVVSDALAATVKGLKDGLVQSGFERIEAKDLIQTKGIGGGTLPLFDGAPEPDLIVPLPEIDGKLILPDGDKLAVLPGPLRKRIEVSPEAGTLTIKDGASDAQIKEVARTFPLEVARKVRESLDTASADNVATPARSQSLAEQGRVVRVPLLSIKQGNLFDAFDETRLLDADWEIDSFDEKVDEAEFPRFVEGLRRAQVTITKQDKIVIDPYAVLDDELALFEDESGWEQVNLVGWLDFNIPFIHAERGQKVAWINSVVNYLVDERKFTIEELAYRKFRLRGAIERKLADGLVRAKQQVFEGLFKDEDQFEVRDEHFVEFKQGGYAYDTVYVPGIRLARHFFRVIGNLKSAGEEFECAELIANKLDNVEWWVRNVERKPNSFWLQTAGDKFYPDFVIRLTNGVTIAVEYKGRHIAEARDSREKRQIGELWAKRSSGRCRFAWVENKNWQALIDAAK
jgi:type III restriction enzyme